MVLDDTLIDKDTRGPVPGIDKDRIVRSVDRINDEPIWCRIEIEQEICVLVCKIFSRAIQVANDAEIGRGFRRKDGIIRARVYMIGFKVEIAKG